MATIFADPTNRIENFIAKAENTIAQRIADGILTKEKEQETNKALDLSLTEFCKFQEEKSLAMMEGLITEAEAMSVYRYLGNTPSHFNRQSTAVKATLTNLFGELLNKRIKQIQGRR